MSLIDPRGWTSSNAGHEDTRDRVVVLEESFTRAEKTLAGHGERDAIQHIRRRFQQQMADSFTASSNKHRAQGQGVPVRHRHRR